MRLTVILGFVLIFILNGCVSEPTRYYLLDSRAPASGTETAKSASLGLDTVTLPDYLNRSEIVSRVTAHRLNVATFDLWAEPLETNITRVLANDLQILMRTSRIALLAEQSADTDFDLSVNIDRFERQASGEVILEASWIVEHDASKRPIAHDVSIHEDVRGQDYDAIVAAMSRALERLSQTIAVGIGARPAPDSDI